MGGRWQWMWPLVMIGALAAAGIVEAVRTGSRGLLWLLILIVVVVAANAWSFRSRAPVAVRTDLARWLERTAAMTGESSTALANRAVSAYRASVGDGDDD